MPGGSSCCVATCKNTYYKTKQLTGVNRIGYISFPKNPHLRKLWVKACKRKDPFHPNSGCVCTVHFLKDDFEKDMQADLGFSKPKFILKPGVVPSLNLGVITTSFSKSKGPSAKTKIQNHEAKEIDKRLSSEEIETIECGPMVFCSEEKGSEKLNYQNMYIELKKENELLIQKFEELKEANEKQESLVKVQIEERVRGVLLSFLSPSQIDLVLKKKTRVKEWKDSELNTALTLRYLSKRGYIYLKQQLNYPLPGISTLERWAANSCMKAKVLDDI